MQEQEERYLMKHIIRNRRTALHNLRRYLRAGCESKELSITILLPPGHILH